MKRQHVILLAAAIVMIGVAALAPEKQAKLLVLEWASKAAAEASPTAILIEMGVTDKEPASWTGQASIKGAKVIHREGYGFRKGDALTGNDGWEASSHWGIKVPPATPAVSRAEKIATVGVVLHLAEVTPDATLSIARKDKAAPAADVSLKDVLGGKPKVLWEGAAVVRLVTTATPVVTTKTENDFPAACYAPDGTLWLAYVSYALKDPERSAEKMTIPEEPRSFKEYYRPEFGDQLFVKSYRGGKWSEPVAVTGPNEDLLRCAIVADKDGNVHVLYGANRNGKITPFRRTISGGDVTKLQPEQQETSLLAPPQAPVASVGRGKETFRAGWQGWKPNAKQDGPDAGHSYVWNYALADGPNGQTASAWDSYRDGDSDVFVVVPPAPPLSIASSKFEARPSLAYDPQGRLWIAYEEGPEQWGKDFGDLVPNAGQPLYNVRSVRVVCLQDGKLFRPAAELPASESPTRTPNEKTVRYAYPRIGIDGKGRVWLTYREKFGTRYSTITGSFWLTMARRLDGDHWTEPIEVAHSDGLLDSRPVLLPHVAGGLRILHNTDGRHTTPETIHNQIYASYVDLPGDPVEPKLVPHDPGKKDPALVKAAAEEREAVERMRKYRVETDAKKYRLLRGEFHRHCELSWDGGPDGSLEDTFRYAIDAADLDWIGPTDHDNGAGREYSWWLTQKLVDAYHVPNAFTPVFAYERSVSYPHGHRNCIFARRGIMTLPRLAESDPKKRVAGVHADDTKMFYRYLRELDGICASHTSATGMGTDWRDNDPTVEPIVEIYQGDRNSYEYEEAPRAGHDPKSGKKPVAVGGWKPDGFINHAFEKGHRLGFQASSDHWSTHVSFCIVLAERHDRAAIVEALKQRRCYAATDNIIADVRSGPHLMGAEFKTGAAPTLKIVVAGTKPIARLEIIRDSKIIATINPGAAEYKGDWTDPKPEAGVHYYYVRVEQEGGELAWTSPLWIDYAK